MREILFRGQTRKYGEKVRMGDGQKLPGRWVYGGVTQGIGSHSIIYGGEKVNDPSDGLAKWCVYTDTLGQFTGLTDKNGTKIFEGDIVDILTENEEIGVVDYDDGGFLVNADGFCVDFHANINGTDLEVIGNIHDNPELLGGKNNGL